MSIQKLEAQLIFEQAVKKIDESKDFEEKLKRELKTDGYQRLKQAISKFDDYSNQDSGVILTKNQINDKCALLRKISQISKDPDIFIEITEGLEDQDIKLIENDLQSDVVFYLMRSEYTYINEQKDKDMAERIRQELNSLKTSYKSDILQKAEEKFQNFIQELQKRKDGVYINDHQASRDAVMKPTTQKTVHVEQSEADKVKFLIKNMAKSVKVGSEWFLVSMKWINKWQKFVGFEESDSRQFNTDDIEQESQDKIHPGKIDNSDIIQCFQQLEKGEIVSTFFQETKEDTKWTHIQIKKNLKEGEDYMLVDNNIHSFWVYKYGKINEIKRYGIEDENGESIVEIYLKQFNIYVVPNQKLLKTDQAISDLNKKFGEFDENQLPTAPVYMSKTATLKDLESKVLRLLNAYIYFKLYKKDLNLRSIRLWRSKYPQDQVLKNIKEIDQKYNNYSQVKIDAEFININAESSNKQLHQVNIADNDILLIEIQKQDSFVFAPLNQGDQNQDDDQFQDPFDNKELNQLKNKKISIEFLNQIQLEQLFKKSSKRGLCGLGNLGNTCFMNSGLQCLSNTIELTKYFLCDLYKMDVNTDNPLGLNGRLAEAYANLLKDMWIGNDRSTAPYDLKRVLGQRVARFSGYGQQDSCELLNYILDLIHEDLNRVKKKPYVELPDHDGQKPDDEMSELFWNAFLARNQSIIVDLMYGQLKSTVKCLECGNISITFDPYLTLSLPITRPQLIQVIFVPFDMFYQSKTVKQDEDDEQTENNLSIQWRSSEQLLFKIDISLIATVDDIKKYVLSKIQKIGQREIYKDNLQLCISESGSCQYLLDDQYNILKIEQLLDRNSKIYLIEKSKEDPNQFNSEQQKCLELNFSKGKLQYRGGVSQMTIYNSIPRFLTFEMEDRVIDIKHKIYNHILNIFQSEEEKQNLYNEEASQEEKDKKDKWINDNILLQIKENLPYIKESEYYQPRKAECEFCGKRHSYNDDICDLKTEKHKNGNMKEEGLYEIKLKDLYSQIKHARELKFEVIIDQYILADYKSFAENIIDYDQENSNSYDGKKKGISIYQCFDGFSKEELLSGNDQWFCNKCKEHRDIHKTLELFKIPKILIVQLKRFQSKKGSSTSGKSGFFNLAYAQICQQERIGDIVNFPINGLDVSKYLKMDYKSAGLSPYYDLFAVSNHYGSLNGGHYTAYAKNVDGNWYDFNDSSVSNSSPSDLVSGASYLLFYRRREDIPVPEQESQIDATMQYEESKQSIRDPKEEAYIYQLD